MSQSNHTFLFLDTETELQAALLTEMTTRHSKSKPMDETDIDSILGDTKSGMEADKEKIMEKRKDMKDRIGRKMKQMTKRRVLEKKMRLIKKIWKDQESFLKRKQRHQMRRNLN